MRKSAFLFLRATCYRWANEAPSLCGELAHLTPTPSVGDAHAGNFGLWRDAEARLVWGVNDFDEAALVPWPFDLVRLGASLLLAIDGVSADDIADILIGGYEKGLDLPCPYVLERGHVWLRDAFAASDDDREHFWSEFDKAAAEARNPANFTAPLRAALGAAQGIKIFRRSAGAGSLGRPRFAAVGQLHGGPIAYEIKGSLPSVWTTGPRQALAATIAAGPYRSPDPTLTYTLDHVIRRLAPDNRKLDFDKLKANLRGQLATAMARELASIHLGGIEASVISNELNALPPSWLKRAITLVADWTQTEWRSYRKQ